MTAAIALLLLAAIGAAALCASHAAELRAWGMRYLPEHDEGPVGTETHRITRTGRIDPGTYPRIRRPELLLAGRALRRVRCR